MLNEGIQNNDLNSLITDTISIDQFKSKIGSDENVVVVAFEVMDKDPAKDLSMFLETGHDFLDVDISQGPNKNGKYNVFVELDRDSKLFFNIEKILKLSGNKKRIIQDKKVLRPKKSEVYRLLCNNKKFTKATNFKPNFNLDDGLKLSISWYRENLEKFNTSKFFK